MKKEILLLMIILMIFSIPLFALLSVGSKAPQFSVENADGNILNLETLRGKAAVGFYVNKEDTKNTALRIELDNFRNEWIQYSASSTFRLAITDASSANDITRFIWKKKIAEKSKKIGITIYADWDGSMKKAYKFKDGDSNFIIIDKRGIIRYLRSGEIPESEFPVIKDLIKKITVETGE